MRVLIAMSDIGGGHRSCGQALRQEFARWFPDRHQVAVADVFRECAPWPFAYLPALYPRLVSGWPGFWRWTFASYGSLVSEATMDRWVGGYCRPFFETLLTVHRPDLIVTVNPLLHPVMLRTLRETGRNIPVAVVVSDLICPHRTWFHARLDLCFVPTGQAVTAALGQGIPARRIRAYGLPLRREFVELAPLDRSHWKRQLGLDPDRPLVLLMGGGEGIGVATLFDLIVNAMDRGELPPVQVAVICGRNQALQVRLRRVSNGANLHVLGFVSDIHRWMAASDCAVTKAGPNTIMEAAATGLPLILSGHVPGQEDHNPAWVKDRGMGVYADSPPAQLRILQQWLTDGALLHRLSRNARAASTVRAGRNIVRELDRRFG